MEDMIAAVVTQFKQFQCKRIKPQVVQRESNPRPSRYRCNTLSTELIIKPSTLEAGQFVGVLSARSRNEVMDMYISSDPYIKVRINDLKEDTIIETVTKFKQLQCLASTGIDLRVTSNNSLSWQ